MQRRRTAPAGCDATFSELVAEAAFWIFSPAFLWRVEDRGHRPLLRRIGLTKALGSTTTVQEMYEQVYAEMLASYRIEYLVKNEIIRRFFLARHDPTNAAVVLEQQVARHSARLDLVVVNDTTTAYEVKTEHDNLDRLERQTNQALRVFDHVVVACADVHLSKVDAIADPRVGLLRVGSRGGLTIERRPMANAARVDPSAVFAVLRKREREEAVRARFGDPPALPDLERYHWYEARFASLPPLDAHDVLLASLRRRHVPRLDHQFGDGPHVKDLCRPMAHLYYKMTRGERQRLLTPRILGSPIG